MVDFLLDAAGDLDLSTNDLQLVDGIDAIRQELQIRYRFFLGEWFLNGAEGVPYVQDVLKKNANESRVRAMLSNVALQTPGVVQVQSLALDIDTATRLLTVTMDLGANVDGTLVYEPFVVEVEL